MSKILKAHLALFLVNALYGANHVVAKGVMPNYLTPSVFIFLRVLGAPTHSVCVQAAQMLEELHLCAHEGSKRWPPSAVAAASRASRRAARADEPRWEREGNGLRGQGNDGLQGNGCLQGNGGLRGNEMPFGRRLDPGVRTSRVK